MKKNYDFPKHHSTVIISLKTPTNTRNIKVIMITSGIFKPLLDFFILNQFKSNSWQNSLSYIVGLFIDYMIACQTAYLKSTKKRIYFLPDFIKLLHYGSIDEQGEDKLGLYWYPKKIYRVTQLENYLYQFLDWYYNNNKNVLKDFLKTDYNELSITEKVFYWRHWSHKKYSAMLSHLKSNTETKKVFQYHKKSALRQSDIYNVHSFNNNYIMNLLFKGFKTNKIKDSYDIRNILITMLLHFGGCRVSEPFHLFVNDIIEDPQEPGKAFVRIYHPEDGYIKYYDKYTKTIIETTRKDYLNTKYGIKPRNLVTGTKYAGWKGLSLDKTGNENYAIIYWFPSWAGKIFWKLYKIYISEILPKNLANPYLFVNLKGKNYGQPYTINAYRDSHKKAVSRIGLTYNKDSGTTPHSHRHAYGQNLENSKIEPKIIQKALHHKSPFSQLIYTAPSIETINSILNNKSHDLDSSLLCNEVNIPSDNNLDKLLEHLNRNNYEK
jgi:site-specific recombinase XerD